METQRPTSPPRASWLLIGSILALGLCLSWWGLVLVEKHYQGKADQNFGRLADHLFREVRRRVQVPVYGMHGARGVFAASQRVTREEFAAYVASRDLADEFPGILGFGFIERVPREDLPAFIAGARADSAPDFTVRTSGDLAVLYPIKYIYPRERNLAAEGYDVGAEAHRREACERAARTGQPSLTARISLVQDTRHSAGFLYLVPIYRNGASTKTE